MPTTLAAQLAALELGHLSISAEAGTGTLARPESEAIDQTLAAVWSDLFALFTDTILEDQAEELGWGFVNLFHRAATKSSTRIDRATDEIRLLLATNDGSEVHTSELEQQGERAQAAEAEMLALENLRETAAALYLAETGSSWKPAGGSRLSHDALTTSAVVQGREFLKARAEGKRRATMPQGTPVVFAGGRQGFPSTDDAKTYGDAIWRTLDRVRANVADMLLVHGGDGKGADAEPLLRGDLPHRRTCAIMRRPPSEPGRLRGIGMARPWRGILDAEQCGGDRAIDLRQVERDAGPSQDQHQCPGPETARTVQIVKQLEAADPPYRPRGRPSPDPSRQRAWTRRVRGEGEVGADEAIDRPEQGGDAEDQCARRAQAGRHCANAAASSRHDV